MPDPEVLEQMRAGWNGRAREDARYYAAFGRRGQQDEEFLASAADVVRSLEQELKRIPSEIPPEARRGLEVGCGPGRLIRAMSRNFGEIHGVDVSDEMIRLAEERFHGASGIRLHVTSGADLSPLASGHFDFVYSYEVFRYIPSREILLLYFAEIRRVLKDGGIARFDLSGLPPNVKAADAFEGVRFSREELSDYTAGNDFQLLALEGAGTPYLWTTWRKQPAGWRDGLKNGGAQAQIQRSGGVHTGEPAVPASGRFARISCRIERLPSNFDLNNVRVTFDGAPGNPYYIGPPDWSGVQALNVILPRGVRTGIVPLELLWLGKPLCPPTWVRLVPAGPVLPRVCSVNDLTDVLAEIRVDDGRVKLIVADLADGEAVSVTIDGKPAAELEYFATDSLAGLFEINLRMPPDLARGSHQLELCQGPRHFAPIKIDVV